MSAQSFSPRRLWAVILKEFVQMRRDRLTFAMMVGIPLLQLALFGFAINNDPRHLPTAVLVADEGPIVRRLLAAMHNSGYFDLRQRLRDEAEAERLLATGEVQFVLMLPSGLERALLRGERPQLLLLADASDPAATGNAVAAMMALPARVLAEEARGPLASLRPAAEPWELVVQRRYNPEGISQYNIVPGLIGVILTMTMIMMTGLAITRERERGTMENLLATPVRPLEVMLGKIAPYVLVAYVQVSLVLLAAALVFQVPMQGSLSLLLAVVGLFVLANLTIGLLFSTLARNQMQAMQMTFFFFLPSMLLSGFMFPFRGMPGWAQALGELLPLTHFLRVIRGILLKGNGWSEIAPSVWPLALFFAVVLLLGLLRFRRTLD